MTISTEAAPISYAGDDSTVSFPVTWKYFDKSHVVVILRDASNVETTWTLGTQYTLTDTGVDSGGTLTVDTAPVDYTPATGETLLLSLEPPNTQDSDLPIGGPFPAETVEDELDESAQRDAKIEAILARAMLVPKTDTQTGSLLDLAIDADRANKFLGFDSNGAPIMVDDTGNNLPANAWLDVDQTWTGAQRMAWVQLTDAATVAVDFDLGNNFYVTVTADRTIGAPTNKTAGQTGYFFVEQDSSGGHTTSWHADWNWGSGNSAPTPTETANLKLMFTYLVDWDAADVLIKFIDEF